jgi:hypothetical protein
MAHTTYVPNNGAKMQITLNTKVAAIVGGTIAVAVAIGGGITAHNNYKAAEAKKAAEIAYANRPIIEDSCLMNGLGDVKCDFTNTGKTAGAVCGVIFVKGPGTAMSSKFCSGVVQPQSTERVETKVVEVDELCDNGYRSWTEKCDFTFIEDEPEGVEA